MDDMRTLREQRRALAGRLIVGDAGALPSADLRGAVVSAYRALPCRLDLSNTTRTSPSQASARVLLTECVVHSRPRVTGGAGTSSVLAS